MRTKAEIEAAFHLVEQQLDRELGRGLEQLSGLAISISDASSRVGIEGFGTGYRWSFSFQRTQRVSASCTRRVLATLSYEEPWDAANTVELELSTTAEVIEPWKSAPFRHQRVERIVLASLQSRGLAELVGEALDEGLQRLVAEAEREQQ